MSKRCPACGEELEPHSMLEWSGWQMNEREQTILADGSWRRLKKQHAEIMSVLIRAKGGSVHTMALWGSLYMHKADGKQAEPHIIEVLLTQLRIVLRDWGLPSAIRTNWNVGRALEPFEEAKKEKVNA